MCALLFNTFLYIQVFPPHLEVAMSKDRLGVLNVTSGPEVLYAAPETFLTDMRSKEADVYGLGMLLFEIFTGCDAMQLKY